MYLRCPDLPSKTEPVIWKLERETEQLTQFSDLKGKVSSCAKILKQVEGKSTVGRYGSSMADTGENQILNIM